jgi:hypothetical protein
MGKLQTMAESDYEKSRPRTPRAEAARREKEAKGKMRELLSVKDEETFRRILIENFGLKPGSQQFESALAAWREGLS